MPGLNRRAQDVSYAKWSRTDFALVLCQIDTEETAQKDNEEFAGKQQLNVCSRCSFVLPQTVLPSRCHVGELNGYDLYGLEERGGHVTPVDGSRMASPHVGMTTQVSRATTRTPQRFSQPDIRSALICKHGRAASHTSCHVTRMCFLSLPRNACRERSHHGNEQAAFVEFPQYAHLTANNSPILPRRHWRWPSRPL